MMGGGSVLSPGLDLLTGSLDGDEMHSWFSSQGSIMEMMEGSFGSSIHSEPRQNSTTREFLTACQTGFLQHVQSYAEDVNIPRKSGTNQSGLHLASANGSLEVVRHLVWEREADAKVKDSQGLTPLHAAAQGGHSQIVKLLIDDGRAEPNVLDSKGRSPFHLACVAGQVGTSKILLRTLEPNGLDAADYAGRTPLTEACKNGHTEVVEFLTLEAGAEVGKRDRNGNTPLHLACLGGHFEAAKAMIEGGGDPNAPGLRFRRRTPLHLVCAGDGNGGSEELLRYLLTVANVNTQDSCGLSALHILASTPTNPSDRRSNSGIPARIRILTREGGANVNAVDDFGRTPLHIACGEGHNTEVGKAFVAAGAEPNSTDSKGNTPLMSCLWGHTNPDMIDYLLKECKADASARNKQGLSPLDIATSRPVDRNMGEWLIRKALGEDAEPPPPPKVRPSRGSGQVKNADWNRSSEASGAGTRPSTGGTPIGRTTSGNSIEKNGDGSPNSRPDEGTQEGSGRMGGSGLAIVDPATLIPEPASKPKAAATPAASSTDSKEEQDLTKMLKAESSPRGQNPAGAIGGQLGGLPTPIGGEFGMGLLSAMAGQQLLPVGTGMEVHSMPELTSGDAATAANATGSTGAGLSLESQLEGLQQQQQQAAALQGIAALGLSTQGVLPHPLLQPGTAGGMIGR